MYELMNEGTVGYGLYDGCYGVVTGRCSKGAYLTLDNGEEAFAYRAANLRPGTEVLCGVQRLASDHRRMVVVVESVTKYPTM